MPKVANVYISPFSLHKTSSEGAKHNSVGRKPYVKKQQDTSPAGAQSCVSEQQNTYFQQKP